MTLALDPPARRVLRALYELAQLDRSADAGLLARAANLSAVDVGRALLALEARGLVRAERARLTLPGLTLAVRCEPLGLEGARWLSQRPACAVRQRVVGLRSARVAGLRLKTAAGARARG